MDRFKMNVVNCAMLGAFVCAMPKQPGGGYRRPIYPWGQIVGSVRHPAAERQVPTGHLHWMGSIPFLFFKTKQHPDGMLFLFWSRVRESMADLPWRQIVRGVRHPAAERQVPTGHLHGMGSIFFLCSERKNSTP